MTRLVPRPDWTPVEFVLAVRAAVWEQGVTPETAANRPTVLALFRPAEEPANGPAICVRCRAPIGDDLWFLRTSPTGRPDQAWCLKCAESTNAEGKRQPAPAAPPPAEERADFKTFKVSFDREWEANVKLRQQVETLRSEVAASQREVEKARDDGYERALETAYLHLVRGLNDFPSGSAPTQVLLSCLGTLHNLSGRDLHAVAAGHLEASKRLSVPPGENRSEG